MSDIENAGDRGHVPIPTKQQGSPGIKWLVMGVAVITAIIMVSVVVVNSGLWDVIFGKPPEKKPEAAKGGEQRKPEAISVPLETPKPSVPQVATVCPNGMRLPPGLKCPELANVPAPNQPAGEAGAAGGMAPDSAPGGTGALPGGVPLPGKDTIRDRRFAGEIAVATQGESPVARVLATVGEGTTAAANAAKGGPTILAAAAPTPSVLEAQLNPISTPGAKASVIANPSLTLVRGTMPDCTLNTAIRTGQPGFLKCTLAYPVYSMDGRVILMEAGTAIEGEYTTGLTQGQASIFVLWTRAITPHNVAIALGSPGTDGLGRSGVPGFVDNKFFDRFAGAIFFSLFEDAAAAAQNKGSSGSGQSTSVNLYTNTSSTTKALVEEMLTQGRAIKPELFKNQGENIHIYIARDVDFSSVYSLEHRPVSNSRVGNGQ
jgi:type IV secretion system protein VirB10